MVNVAFVRTKSVDGNKYYQLVRNYREGGKHRQEVLYHLGKHRSLEAAIKAETDELNYLWGERAFWLEESEDFEIRLRREEDLERFFNGEMPGLGAAQERQEDLQKRFREYFESPQSEQSWEYLEELRLEDLVLEDVFGYYKALERASYYDELVVDQAKKLDKLLDLQRKYSRDSSSGLKRRQTARSSVRYGLSNN